jgi:glutamate-1-semialdehyde 2,1-aminomutase
LDLAHRVLPGGTLHDASWRSHRARPFIVAKAEGSCLWDTDGNPFLDFQLGASTLILGHNHPAVVDAAKVQLDRGIHYLGLLHEPAVRLANEVTSASRCAERVVFTATGTDAVLNSLRVARAFTGKDKVMRFEGTYHGTSDYAMFGQAFGESGTYPDAVPACAGVPRAAGEAMLVAPNNDLEVARRLVAENHQDLAAILVDPDPIGYRLAPDILPGLRETADEFGILLVFDEVVTGFRLAYGGAQQYFDVTPDLAAYGKALGGGFPVGAVTGSAEVMKTVDPSARKGSDFAKITGTFTTNPIGCAAGLAVLERIKAPGFHDSLNQRGAEFRRAMQSIFSRHGVQALVGGIGSFWEIHFAPKMPSNYGEFCRVDSRALERFDRELLRRGIFVLTGLRRSLCAVHRDEDLEYTLAAIDDICRTGDW